MESYSPIVQETEVHKKWSWVVSETPIYLFVVNISTMQL